MFSPAPRKGEKDKRTTLLHHRCSFQGKWIGDISHSGHVGVSGFCKTIPKAGCKLVLCNTRETEKITNNAGISMSPSFFLFFFFLVIGCCLWKWNFVVRSTLSIFGSSKIASDQLRNRGSEHSAVKLLHVLGEPKFILSYLVLHGFLRYFKPCCLLEACAAFQRALQYILRSNEFELIPSLFCFLCIGLLTSVIFILKIKP